MEKNFMNFSILPIAIFIGFAAIEIQMSMLLIRLSWFFFVGGEQIIHFPSHKNILIFFLKCLKTAYVVLVFVIGYLEKSRSAQSNELDPKMTLSTYFGFVIGIVLGIVYRTYVLLIILPVSNYILVFSVENAACRRLLFKSRQVVILMVRIAHFKIYLKSKKSEIILYIQQGFDY
jgi:hypothetical protein